MTYTCRKILTCLACGTRNLTEILDLGEQPPANSYVSTITDQNKYPLKLEYCSNCTHLQISHQIHPDILFKDYAYVSGTTSTGKQYFENFASFTKKYVSKHNRNILDIACNDGTQLDYFKALGDATFGIDPAENLFSTASKNHNIVCDYLTNISIAKFGVNFDVIIAQNVFAHLDYTLEFLEICKQHLAGDGVIIVQTSQANMVSNGEFDTIYHEHLSFFNARSMQCLAERAGLKIIAIDKPSIHGTSYVFVLSVNGKSVEINEPAITQELISEYVSRVTTTKEELKLAISDLQNLGYTIIGYGAAAKGNTVLNYTGIKLDYIVDDNPLKQNKLAPGSNIPIVSSERLYQEDRSKLIVVPLAWNFFDEIRLRVLKAGKTNVKFMRYFPNIELV